VFQLRAMSQPRKPLQRKLRLRKLPQKKLRLRKLLQKNLQKNLQATTNIKYITFD
jgi:hypothetical protein